MLGDHWSILEPSHKQSPCQSPTLDRTGSPRILAINEINLFLTFSRLIDEIGFLMIARSRIENLKRKVLELKNRVIRVDDFLFNQTS
jgi:hypothetical protein